MVFVGLYIMPDRVGLALGLKRSRSLMLRLPCESFPQLRVGSVCSFHFADGIFCENKRRRTIALLVV